MIQLRRKGKMFVDDGMQLLYKPGEPFKVKGKRRLEFLKHNNPVAFKEAAEGVVIEIVKWLQAQAGGEPVELAKVYQEGAFHIGVSPETVKRYVFAHSAGGAELITVGKRVKVNVNFKPAVDEDEEEDGG